MAPARVAARLIVLDDGRHQSHTARGLRQCQRVEQQHESPIAHLDRAAEADLYRAGARRSGGTLPTVRPARPGGILRPRIITRNGSHYGPSRVKMKLKKAAPPPGEALVTIGLAW